MSIELGKKFNVVTVTGFVSKEIRVVNGKGEIVAFVKTSVKGDILSTTMDISSDKDGKDILFSYRAGNFMNVYGEKLGELYAKTFRCRKPLLLKTGDNGEFRVRTNSILRMWLPVSHKYVLEGANGIEATFTANTNRLECEIAENSTLPPELILALTALTLIMPPNIDNADDLSRVLEAEDEKDLADARFPGRVLTAVIFLIIAGAVIEMILKKIFK